MARIPEGAGYIAAYLCGVATILVLQALQPDARVVVVPGTANILARPPTTTEQPASQPVQQPQNVPTATVATCRADSDCASPTAICALRYGICEELRSPSCVCSQPQVLRCSDAANRSRHTFCQTGCEATADGARCL